MKHASRYPIHKGDEGTVWNGECNRTVCKAPHAVYYNTGTYGYYCTPCARAINYREMICILVDHDLDGGEMDAHYEARMQRMRQNRY